MKRLILAGILVFITCFFSQKAEAQSTILTPGSILPNMTTMQRTEVLNPPNGMLVFDSNTQSYWFRQSGAWVELPKGGSTSNYWELDGLGGNELKNTNSSGFWSANATFVDFDADDVTNPPTAPINGEGTRLMWIPSRAAFRAGSAYNRVQGSRFDSENIGLFSVAIGGEVLAKGYGSVSFGIDNSSTGVVSTTWGSKNLASGYSSTAFGLHTEAKSDYSTVIGSYNNVDDNPVSGLLNLNPLDRLFQIGNGTNNLYRSNAFTVLRNGNVGTLNVTDPKANLHLQYNQPLNWDAHLRLQYDADDWGNIVYDFDGFKFRTFGSNDDFIFRNAVGTGTQVARIFHTGNMTIIGTLTQNSDERLKTNLKKIENSSAKLKSLNAYHYNWKAEDRESGVQTGLIAQEIQKEFPELVKADEESYLSVNYIGLIPHLIEAHKELKAENELLKERLFKIEQKLKLDSTTMTQTAF